MSKGDWVRPMQVPRETFEQNWEAIFGRKDEPEEPETEPEDGCSEHRPG